MMWIRKVKMKIDVVFEDNNGNKMYSESIQKIHERERKHWWECLADSRRRPTKPA